jgi:hypothetical protein
VTDDGAGITGRSLHGVITESCFETLAEADPVNRPR